MDLRQELCGKLVDELRARGDEKSETYPLAPLLDETPEPSARR
jgi:hypothetical protein